MSAPDRSQQQQQQPRMTVSSSVGISTPALTTTATTSDTFSRAGSTLTTLSATTLPRRHSIYGTGEDRIVLDIGSLYIKCGFSGEARPRHIVPVHAGNMKFHWMLDSCGSGGSEKECSEGCRLVGEFAELFDLQIGCKEEDLDALYDRLSYFLREVYFRYLLTDSKHRKVVLCEPPMMPLKLKELIAKVLFENLQVPSISFAPSHMLALLTTGSTTGLVIDCGHLETTAMPTFSARPLTSFVRTTPLAGRALTNRLRNLLCKSAKMIIPPDTKQVKVIPEYLTHTIIEDIKTRFIFVSPMQIPANGRICVAEKTPEDSMEKKYANDSKVEDLYYPFALGTVEGKNQIGTLVVPGWIRGRAAEVLFEGDEDESSVVGCLLESLLKTPIHLRRSLASSILLIGGTTLLPNFQVRFSQEILRALRVDKRFTSISGLVDHIGFLEESGSGKVFVANCRAWVGGSLIGSLKSTTVELTREKFEGEVPDWSLGNIPKAV